MTYTDLSGIPNQVGFEFIGITHDDNEIQCIVKKNSIGLHGIYSNGVPVYFQLKSWRNKSNKKVNNLSEF